MATQAKKTESKEASEVKSPDEYLNEKVEIKLFKDGKEYKDDYIVAVNGKVWQIQRGKTVKVPRYVAMQIDSSQRQDLYAAQLAEKRADESKFA